MTKKSTLLLVALISFLLCSYSTCLDYLTSPSDGIDTNTSGSDDNNDPSSVAYVRVDLNSGGYEDFEYNSFFLWISGWGSEDHLKIYDSNGTDFIIQKENMTKIVFYGQTWSGYLEKNCWEFRIYYSGTSITGHVNSSSTRSVGGNDLDSGAYKKIKWSNISQIEFYR